MKKKIEKIGLVISLFIYSHISKNLGLKIRECIVNHHRSDHFDDISITYTDIQRDETR